MGIVGITGTMMDRPAGRKSRNAENATGPNPRYTSIACSERVIADESVHTIVVSVNGVY